ncbi:MAG: sugar phosphate isomerase/epimerase [Clostridiales bacterium]|jgi:sugar phosphate isomerase/epimerase|nr:sugar phosphate isomerase/epimerase [Clostridiales bacterium]
MPLIKEFSLQLYSLRSEADKGIAPMLREVAKVGYTGVEFAGYGGLSAPEMKKLLTENKLAPVGTHVSITRLNEALDEELAFNKEIGTEYIIVPHLKMDGEADVREAAKNLRAIAPKIRAAGFGFAYHNHAHEFAKDASGRYLIDLLSELVPAEEMDLELDLYWAAYAGADYLSWMRGKAGRVKLLHIKQIADFETKKCVDLDEGVIDFREIIKVGLELGVLHFILEQEEFAVSPYVSIKKGCEHILSL